MRQIVDEFNATVGREKKIYVRYLSTSAIEQKTLVATAAGVPPDIAGLYNQNIPQFAAMDALEPLDELAAAHGITADTYKPVFWDECRYEGRLYGLVSTRVRPRRCTTTRRSSGSARDAARRGARSRSRRRARSPSSTPTRRRSTQVDASGRIDVRRLPAAGAGLVSELHVHLVRRAAGGTQANKQFTFTDPGVVRAYEWIQSYSKRLGAQSRDELPLRAGQLRFAAERVPRRHGRDGAAGHVHGELHPASRSRRWQGKWAAAPFPSAIRA